LFLKVVPSVPNFPASDFTNHAFPRLFRLIAGCRGVSSWGGGIEVRTNNIPWLVAQSAEHIELCVPCSGWMYRRRRRHQRFLRKSKMLGTRCYSQIGKRQYKQFIAYFSKSPRTSGPVTCHEAGFTLLTLPARALGYNRGFCVHGNLVPYPRKHAAAFASEGECCGNSECLAQALIPGVSKAPLQKSVPSVDCCKSVHLIVVSLLASASLRTAVLPTLGSPFTSPVSLGCNIPPHKPFHLPSSPFRRRVCSLFQGQVATSDSDTIATTHVPTC